ncbi:MAG: DUF2117 domain-containing protein [Methanobrevibacter sp.]|jgi:hypothetical protein|nr:DUF2117 domain-containing protein [Methanobrevibacter sp.]
MKIGIVVHGPNIIDSGYATQIIYHLSNFGEIQSRLGGTMGRTAVIDANLENIIDISSKLLPSESVKLFKEDNSVDAIFLLNYGKSSVTGHTFGYKVYKNSFLNDSIENNHNTEKRNTGIEKRNTGKIAISSIPFIQIERPGEVDGSVIQWNGEPIDLTSQIAKLLDLKVIKPETIINKYFANEDSQNLEKEKKEKDESKTKSKTKSRTNSKTKSRKIHGVSKDENIFVNGIVIGKSTSDNLTIIAKNNYIVDIKGGVLKEHGIEKLGEVDIDKAIVKTGLLRKAIPNPRIIANDIESINSLSKNVNKDILRIAIVDHAAQDIYSLNNCDLVVTIGDDTTLIASDILYRFNIPVIGITDGDLDKVVEKGFKSKNSIIIEVEEGFDDIIGEAIFNEIFDSENLLEIHLIKSNSSDYCSNSNKDYKYDLKENEINDFKNKILEIVKNISPKYNINNL